MKSISYTELDTLFLDVGNTLISMNYDWIAEEFCSLGFEVNPQELRRAEAAARPLFSRGLKSRSTEGRDAFVFYLSTVLKCLPKEMDIGGPRIDEIARTLAEVLLAPQGVEELWSSPTAGTTEALEALKKRGLRLVAVSNSDGTVEDILIRLDLRSYLTKVYDSFQVGFEKPDPRIFLHVMDDLGLDPSRVLHVGDLYDIDVVGARAAGLDAVLVDPFGDWTDVDCESVKDLEELSQRIISAQC